MIKDLTSRVLRGLDRRVRGFSYDMAKNGEFQLLKVFAKTRPSCLFDVGANVGEWTRYAHSACASAKIHCFEISAENFRLLSRYEDNSNIFVHHTGLSDFSGEIEYKDYGRGSGKNTILKDLSFHDSAQEFAILTANVAKGDDFCASNDIDFIDFLKIDVEGAEALVVRGFADMLQRKAVRLVQFEYGYANGDAKFLMKDFFEYFGTFGYKVGRLGSSGVDFCEWSYALNDFDSGPNYVAVRSDDGVLEKLISR